MRHLIVGIILLSQFALVGQIVFSESQLLMADGSTRRSLMSYNDFLLRQDVIFTKDRAGNEIDVPSEQVSEIEIFGQKFLRLYSPNNPSIDDFYSSTADFVSDSTSIVFLQVHLEGKVPLLEYKKSASEPIYYTSENGVYKALRPYRYMDGIDNPDNYLDFLKQRFADCNEITDALPELAYQREDLIALFKKQRKCSYGKVNKYSYVINKHEFYLLGAIDKSNIFFKSAGASLANYIDADFAPSYDPSFGLRYIYPVNQHKKSKADLAIDLYYQSFNILGEYSNQTGASVLETSEHVFALKQLSISPNYRHNFRLGANTTFQLAAGISLNTTLDFTSTERRTKVDAGQVVVDELVESLVIFNDTDVGLVFEGGFEWRRLTLFANYQYVLANAGVSNLRHRVTRVRAGIAYRLFSL